MALPNNTIEKIKVNNIDHSLIAGYITTGGTTPAYKTWTDIEGLVAQGKVKFAVCNAASNTPKGVTFTPKGGSTAITGTLEANAADLTTFYLVYDNNGTKDQYDEYVSTGTEWEKIGDTGVDLSNYVTKNIYTTGTPSTNVTGEAAAYTATVSGTVKYTKADTVTGSAGGTTTTNTGAAGGVTIQGSNFSFNGTTVTISVTGNYTPAGTISKPNITMGNKSTITYVDGVANDGTVEVLTGVTSNGTTAAVINAIKGLTSSTQTSQGAITYVESFTHAGASLGAASTTTVLTGVTSDGSDTAIKTLGTGSFFNGATVTNGVLSFNSGDAYNSVSASFTAIKGVKANGTATVITGYPNFSGGGATPTTKYLTGTALAAADKATVLTGVKGDGTATVVKSTGLSTATFNNFTSAALASAPTFYGTQDSIALSADYTPAGTIGGSQVVAAHSHSYVELKAHTHSVGKTDNVEASVSLGAAISAHTHTLGNHTHSVDLTN
ncbi:MAG: hypothetical protein J6T10_04570 [Methanobrevibacter sp.]|nr:hypothetical protein [Methanobrevibacter sp.]